MKRVLTLAAIAGLALASTGCAIHHDIQQDYPQYLAGKHTNAPLPSTPLEAGYALTPKTEQHRYEFRAASVGYANIWVVEFGKMLDQTLQSGDVQAAFGKLEKRSDGKAGSNLVFDLRDYSFRDHGAHIELQISVSRDGTERFVKTYRAAGKTQGAKMIFGGAFAMRDATQQSTKWALDDILRQFISDLNTDLGKPTPTTAAAGG